MTKLTRRNKLSVYYTTTPGNIEEKDCTTKMTPRQFVQAVESLKQDVGNGSVFKAAYYKGKRVDYHELETLVYAPEFLDYIEL